MPTFQRVQQAARNLAVVVGTVGMGDQGKRYEAWLMLEIGLTLRQHGHRAVWRACHTGNPRNVALFRGAPGSMRQCHVSTDAPGFLVFEFNNTLYELHNSIQYCGVSGTLHEVDLSIIPHRDGSDLRAGGGGYPLGSPNVALELKRYRYGSGFSVGLMRAMLLGATDLTLRQWPHKPSQAFDILHLDAQGAAAFGCLKECAWVAVTTVAQIGASRRLATHYGATIEDTFRVHPTQPPGMHPRVNKLVANLGAYL